MCKNPVLSNLAPVAAAVAAVAIVSHWAGVVAGSQASLNKPPLGVCIDFRLVMISGELKIWAQ